MRDLPPIDVEDVVKAEWWRSPMGARLRGEL
jgi:hypothetical protein